MAKLDQSLRAFSSDHVHLIIKQAKDNPKGVHCRFKLPGGLGQSALMTAAGVMGGKLIIFGSHVYNPSEQEILTEIPLSCIANQSGKFTQMPTDGVIVKWAGASESGHFSTNP